MSSEPPISEEVISAKVRELRSLIEAQEEQLDRMREELQWWETGQRLFGGPPEPTVTHEVGSNGSKPSLREGITAVLADGPAVWKTEDVIEELQRRDWLPNGKNAAHHVRSMLAEMHRKGQARRVTRGRYRLPVTQRKDE